MSSEPNGQPAKVDELDEFMALLGLIVARRVMQALEPVHVELGRIRASCDALNAKLDALTEEEEETSSVPMYDMGGKLIP